MNHTRVPTFKPFPPLTDSPDSQSRRTDTKGVLTAVTVLFMLDWVMALICLGIFVIVVALTSYVSLGTICAALFFLVIAFVPAFEHTIYFCTFSVL